MRLWTLPQHITRRLLQHEKDILTPATEARAKKYAVPCPRCGGAQHQHLAERPFSSGDPLPRTYARCVDCGHETDTSTGVITAVGNPALVEPPFPIIDPKE